MCKKKSSAMRGGTSKKRQKMKGEMKKEVNFKLPDLKRNNKKVISLMRLYFKIYLFCRKE